MSKIEYGSSDFFTSSAVNTIYNLKNFSMQKDKSNKQDEKKENTQKEVSMEGQHNPFKKTSVSKTEQETPQQEAETEQQRKETLTERD